MQVNSVLPNTFLIRAVLNSVTRIGSTLHQAAAVTTIAAGTTWQVYSDATHGEVFENLHKLIVEARIQLQNIELTLEEEMEYINEEVC